MMWKHYFFAVMGGSVLLFVATALFNILVDPYDLWMVPRYQGLNLCAVRSEDRERLSKPIHIIHDKPNAIFLGNSKCDFSIDPDRFTQITGCSSSYNMAMRNGQPHELRKCLELALKNNPELDTVILEVDFEMFLSDSTTKNGFDEKQTSRTHITRDNAFRTTLSGDACIDSLLTLKRNHEFRYDHLAYERNGKLSEGSLFSIFSDEASFYKNTRSFLVAKYLDNRHFNEDIYKDKFHEIECIAELCKENNIELKVFVPPVHAIHLDAYDMYWEHYAQWEKELASIVPFTDFARYNAFTMTDPDLPLEENPHFWDSAHIKVFVGDMVLDCLYGIPNGNTPENFAVQVTAENVEEHLAETKQQHAEWASQNTQLKNKLAAIGQFVSQCPSPSASEAALMDNLATIDKLGDGITLQQTDILFFEGTLSLDSHCIQTVYTVLEDPAGKRFYTMLNKKWNANTTDWAMLFRPSTSTAYDFMTGAILQNVPPGEYQVRTMVVQNDGKSYISPGLRKLSVI